MTTEATNHVEMPAAEAPIGDIPVVETSTTETPGASTPTETPKTGKALHTHFTRIARKVLLASIGAVALAQEEIEDFVDRLVERGEIAEQDGRKLLIEIKERRKKAQEKAAEKAAEMELKIEQVVEKRGEPLRKRIEAILERMNIATKADIAALSEKVTALNQKIDQLKR